MYELKLNGIGHISTNSKLKTDTYNIVQYYEMAEEYWKVGQSFEKGDSEMIFCGEVQVVRKIGEFHG